MNILVVDTCPKVADSIKDMLNLTHPEFGITAVNSVSQAVDALESQIFDLVLTNPLNNDLLLSDFVAKVKRRNSSTKVVLMSAFCDKAQDSIRLNCEGFILKPILSALSITNFINLRSS